VATLLDLSTLNRPELLNLLNLLMGDEDAPTLAGTLAGVNPFAGLALGAKVALTLCRLADPDLPDADDSIPPLPLADPDAAADEAAGELRAALGWLDTRASVFAGSNRLLGLARVLGQAAGLVKVELARREAQAAALDKFLGAMV
jgi:hypothetical protein